MAHRLWLEVALNGNWGRRLQPQIPISAAQLIAEGLACADEGAAIIHLHTYDEQSGAPRMDADAYARVIDGIRSKRDVIVYPTVDSERTPGSDLSMVGPERYAVIETLAARKLLEWSAVDPGSVNLVTYAALEREAAGLTYLNPKSDVRAGLAQCVRHDLRPSYAIYEPGFLRLGAALAACTAGLRSPLYRFMFSDGMTFGMPPREYALSAYRSLMDEFAPGAAWMVAGYMVDPTPLIPSIVAAGGHLRVGLEDAPLGSEHSNVQWVTSAARAVVRQGSDLAPAKEIRAALEARDTAAQRARVKG